MAPQRRVHVKRLLAPLLALPAVAVGHVFHRSDLRQMVAHLKNGHLEV